MRAVLTLTVAIALAAAFGVMAHSGATGIVKQRMDAMSDMGDHSKLLGKMFKGKVDFDLQAVRDAADAFVEHAGEMLQLFPDTKDSRHGHKSQSKQVVWEDWDDFSEQVESFLSASQSLRDVSHASDDEAELKKAFFAAAKGCKSCHKVYRKPKKK